MLLITVMYNVCNGPDGMVGLNANSHEDSSVERINHMKCHWTCV